MQDKDAMIPSDQELTKWVKKSFSNNSWYNINFCKVFMNPRTFHTYDEEYTTKFSVIVHCTNEDWHEFNV